MKNRWLFAALAAGLLAASGCSKKEETETEAPAPVQVTAVTQEPIRHIVAGDGILFPQDQTGVMPNISKPVLKFYANRGDHVKQGQLLASLESRDLAAAVANAKSQVSQAELNLHTVEMATVPEAVVKAETDVQSDTQQLDAAQKLLDSQTELFRQGALAGGWMRPEYSLYPRRRNCRPHRNTSARSTRWARGIRSPPRGPRCKPLRPSCRRPTPSSVTRRFIAPRPASSPTAPSMKAKWPCPARPSSPSSISRAWSLASTSRRARATSSRSASRPRSSNPIAASKSPAKSSS